MDIKEVETARIVDGVHRTMRYKATLAMLLNIVQIICGAIMSLLTSLSFGNIFWKQEHPLAGFSYGSLFLIAGLTGLLAAKYKTYGFIIPNMAFSILATISAALGIAIYGKLLAGSQLRDVRNIIMAAASFLVSVAEIIAAIWVSVISGNIVCPCRGTDRGGEGKVFVNYNKRLSCGFGIAQIVLSVVILVFAITKATVAREIGPYTSTGINKLPEHTEIFIAATASSFLGILLAGIFGIVSAVKRTLPLIIPHMIFTIMSAFLMGLAIVFAPLAIVDSSHPRHIAQSSSYQHVKKTNIALDVVLLLLCLAEFILAVWSSTLGCRVTWCGAVDQVPPRQYATHNKVAGLVLGSVQIVCGIISIALASVVWGITRILIPDQIQLRAPVIASGIICGVMYIIAGIFGIIAAKTKVRSKILAHWILSLSTILTVFTQFGFGVHLVLIEQTYYIGIGVCLILLSIVEMVVPAVVSYFNYLSTRDDAYRTRNFMRQQQLQQQLQQQQVLQQQPEKPLQP